MDLYALLGVARSASVAEIERAYRRLARRYHPGVNPGDQVSEEVYRQIQNAYQVLTDAGRRRAYDRGPAEAPEGESAIAFAGFDFSRPAEGPLAATFSELFADVFQGAAREATTPTRGTDIDVTLRLPFARAAEGGDMSLSVTRQVRCAACDGHGRVRRPATVCARCHGAGTRRWARGHLVFTKPCAECRGRGRADTAPCRACAAVGTTARTEVIAVSLPPGLESGARVAVPGHGHAGARGGPTGDLYVTVEVAEHPFFRRVGRDLHVVVPVAVHEAALGTRIAVPTIAGPARLKIPPGTPSGRRLRLRGRGLRTSNGTGDETGDLIIEIQIVLPPELDDASKALMREFGRLNGDDVRRHLFGES